MKNRARLTGALALAAGSSLAVFATAATATNGSITLTCAQATFAYDSFGPAPQARPPWTLSVDGVSVTDARYPDGTFPGPNRSATYTIPLNLSGDHHVAGTTKPYPTSPLVTVSAHVSCPQPPPAVVRVTTPPAPITTPRGTITIPGAPTLEPLSAFYVCATLPKGAGARWRSKLCAKTPHRALRPKPNPVTCATRWRVKPRVTVRYTVRGSDGWFRPIAAQGRLCGRAGGVAGGADS